jgi:hypothetical protein
VEDFSKSDDFSYEISATFNSNDNEVTDVKPAYGGMIGGSWQWAYHQKTRSRTTLGLGGCTKWMGYGKTKLR